MATATATRNGKQPDAETKVIKLRRLEQAQLKVNIEGVTPVIPHQWSEKAKTMMRDKQFNPGGARAKREAKDPEEEAKQSCYWLDAPKCTKPGMPAVAFKAAMVGACRFFEEPTMTLAKLLFYVEGVGSDQLVAVKGTLNMREDTPRNASGVVDLRYRYEILAPWTATLTVHFMPTQIDPDSVINLVDAAGRLGVGDWRPSAPKSMTGTYGQWKVVY